VASRRLRVLMINPKHPPPVVGGLQRQAHELSKALVGSQDVSVTVLSTRFDCRQAYDAVVDGIRIVRIPWECNRLLRYLVTTFRLAYEIVRLRGEVDVVHAHQFSPFCLFSIVLFGLLRRPVVVKIASSGRGGVWSLRRQKFGRARMFALRRASAVVSMTARTTRELHRAGFCRNRILEVPNGIRTDDLGLSCGYTNRRHKGGCRVVFVGRPDRREKGVDILLKAWKRVVAESGPEAVLEIWGEGPERPSLQALGDELGITASLRWLGHVEEVRERLRECDIFVLTSWYEGNSNAILEAMAAGLPVVATKVGGAKMQVGAVGRAFLCEPGDHEEIAARITRLIRNPRERAHLGSAMQSRVRERYCIDAIAAEYARAYADLVAYGHLASPSKDYFTADNGLRPSTCHA